MKKYDEFCEQFHGVITPYPCDSAQVCLYITFMYKQLKYSSIKNYVTALSNELKLRGFSGVNYTDYNIQRCLKGTRRLLGDRRKQATALLPKELLLITSYLKDTVGHTGFRAALLTSFRGLLRKAHVTASDATLCRGDITFHKWGMLIHVSKSKTIQFAERIVEIPVTYSPLEELCAVRWTQRHFSEVPAGKDEPAFRIPHPAGSVPLAYDAYQATLKHICGEAGLDPKEFSSHSLRRGGATFLSLIGASIQEIKQRGDWKSDAVFEYLKAPLSARIADDMKVADLLMSYC